MNYAKISQVAHYAPRQVVSNDDLAEIMDTSDEWISSRTGIKNRHLSSDETTNDCAEWALYSPYPQPAAGPAVHAADVLNRYTPSRSVYLG